MSALDRPIDTMAVGRLAIATLEAVAAAELPPGWELQLLVPEALRSQGR